MDDSTIFLSYSRRQLYFAESLALHLQQGGLDVWFDLQQLHAGTVWSDGLKHGVRDAERLVLVVSRAALESPWTREEWEGIAAKGCQLVLAVFEPVTLPEELRGLPTFDFRTGFATKLASLTAYLQYAGEPCHDRIPAPNRLGLPVAMPATLWVILGGLAAPFLACLLQVPFALATPPGSEDAFGVGRWSVLGSLTVCSAFVVVRGALPFLYRSITFKNLKRGLRWSMALCVLTALVAITVPFSPVVVWFLLAMLLVNIVIYGWTLRHSANLLRWLQADDELQGLRRRVHQPLAAKSTHEVDAPIDATSARFTYALHADAADAPLARRIERILDRDGHTRVAPEGEPDHHIAILTNRSSAPWVQNLTTQHAGRLVCVIASTIELGERLAETARYQWVDFRDGDPQDVHALARSLGDPEGARREAGLEATPDRIDRWKVPSGIGLLKLVTEWLGAAALIIGLGDYAGAALTWCFPRPGSGGNLPRSAVLIVVGVVFLWMAIRALIYRRVSALAMYAFLLGVPAVAVLYVNGLPDFTLDDPATKTAPIPWVIPALYVLFVLYSLLDGYYWLPRRAPRNREEVGIKRSVMQTFRRRNIIKVTVWIVLLVAVAVAPVLLTDPPGK